jgi:hypothetical protein
MATAFDGLGLGQLGSERRFMTGDNPLSQGLKGLKDFAIMSAINKSGLTGFLNDLGKPKDNQSSLGMAVPPSNFAPVGINPQAASNWGSVPNLTQDSTQDKSTQPLGGPSFNNANQPQQKSIEDAADEAMNLSKSTSFVSPNVLNAPDTQSEGVLNRASQPAAPPGGMMLPQYGQSQSGGNQVASAVLNILPTLFGLG